MSDLKPIKLYHHLAGGPNPVKASMLLQELGLPYECIFPDMAKLKEEPFTNLNPNGRLPVIEDPNTGLVLWESGAIIDYLVETYDKEAKLHYTSFPEKWQQKAWAAFQISGQGPYFGQLMWFLVYHQEKLPSVIDRYKNEWKRVLGVINSHLKKTGQPYLVGEKICYADLMFVSWNHLAIIGFGEGFEAEFEKDLPHYFAWYKKLEERESVKKVYANLAKMQEEKGFNKKH